MSGCHIPNCLSPCCNDLFKQIKSIESEVKELKRFQDITHAQYQNVINKRQPYKCPVCEGCGGVDHPLTGKLVKAVCHACEGKGIVWG